jgi:hypothetical protein
LQAAVLHPVPKEVKTSVGVLAGVAFSGSACSLRGIPRRLDNPKRMGENIPSNLPVSDLSDWMSMKPPLALTLCLIVAAVCPAAGATQAPLDFDDIRPQLENLLSDMAGTIRRLESVQEQMEHSGKANQDYNEQKNIFISSMLAITTIVAVCEYEADHLALFMDLRAQNRSKLYAIRIAGLETSMRQVDNMRRQLEINYAIFPPEFFEASLVARERKATRRAVDLLSRCIMLLGSAAP